MQASAQIFDRDHLTAQTAGDIALQDEILTLFVRQSTEILDLLGDQTALPQTRADLAHKLQGSARAIGAFALADAAEIVETRFRSSATADAALTELTTAFGASHAEIYRHLGRSRGGW